MESKDKILAIRIVQKFREAGHTSYFAGGCVRDMIMRCEPTDFDIATTATPDIIEKMFEKTVPVGKQFGVMIVVLDESQFEVATFRGETDYADGRHPNQVYFTSPENDANRRDFTINGLFYDPIQSKVIDYVTGQADIQKKIVRTIGDPTTRFTEDKLRLLRAIRFANNLGFSIEKKTWDAIKQMASQITCVSHERIRDELIKLFTRKNAGDGLEMLFESGLLKHILPEIEMMKGVEQQPDFHPEGDVFVHTKILMNKLQNPSVTLAFGSLLHDVGKPETRSVENGRIRFYSHEHVGAEIAEKILRRLRFSNTEIEQILSCVTNHMKFANVKQMREGKLKQFITRANFLDELELHRIDCESSHGMLDNYSFLKGKIVEYQKENLKPKPFINGNDLIAIGIRPGPVIKQILEEAYTLQLEDKWKSKEEVLKWVRQKFLQEKAI